MKKILFWIITLALSFYIANFVTGMINHSSTFLSNFSTMSDLFAWGAPIGCFLYNINVDGDVEGIDYFFSIASSIFGIGLAYFLALYFSFFAILFIIICLIFII